MSGEWKKIERGQTDGLDPSDSGMNLGLSAQLGQGGKDDGAPLWAFRIRGFRYPHWAWERILRG